MAHDIAKEIERIAEDLGVDRKRSIGDVAKELGVETHVIRFWEENFPQIKPEIGSGKRRYYYNKQLKILKRIKKFLYEEGYTIAGLQKLLKKRKQDENKEEDLDVLTQQMDLDDFIDPSVEIEVGASIDPQAKLRDFAKLKIADMDPRVRQTITESAANIRKNLKKLKQLNSE